MRLFLSAGEASGDAYAARLLRSIRERRPNLEVQAVGGTRLLESGVEPIADSRSWGALGILEALKVAPRVYSGYRKAVQALQSGPPGLFIPVDFGYMNVKLCRQAHARGWKVLYFIPPGSWRRDQQGADLPEITDALVTPFSWSADLLRQAGAQAHWFGHPLVQMVSESNAPRERRARQIALLPGSRTHEIEHNLPVIAQAVRGLADQVEFAVAPNVDPADLQRLWAAHRGLEAALWTQGDPYGVLQRSQAALLCSGTATLESALCECPCVVMYRGSRWMEFEYRIRKPKFSYIALPNLLLDEPVVPERIQHDAHPEQLRRDLAPLLDANSSERRHQQDAFARLRTILGPATAFDQSADLAVSMLESIQQTSSGIA